MGYKFTATRDTREPTIFGASAVYADAKYRGGVGVSWPYILLSRRHYVAKLFVNINILFSFGIVFYL